MNFNFLNESVGRWVLMLIILMTVAVVWNGVLREMV